MPTFAIFFSLKVDNIIKKSATLVTLRLSLFIQKSAFFTAKIHAQSRCGFARGRKIQNNADCIDHSELSPFVSTPTIFASYPITYIITETTKKCKSGTKKNSTFFFVIFSQ